MHKLGKEGTQIDVPDTDANVLENTYGELIRTVVPLSVPEKEYRGEKYVTKRFGAQFTYNYIHRFSKDRSLYSNLLRPSIFLYFH